MAGVGRGRGSLSDRVPRTRNCQEIHPDALEHRQRDLRRSHFGSESAVRHFQNNFPGKCSPPLGRPNQGRKLKAIIGQR